jgi:hypothetical protein
MQLGLETLLPWVNASFILLLGGLFARAAYRLGRSMPLWNLNASVVVAGMARFLVLLLSVMAGIALAREASQQANYHMMELYLALTVEFPPNWADVANRYFWYMALALVGYRLGWRIPQAGALFGLALAYHAAWPASRLIGSYFRPYALYHEQMTTIMAYSQWTFILVFGGLLAFAGHRLGRLAEPRLRAAEA